MSPCHVSCHLQPDFANLTTPCASLGRLMRKLGSTNASLASSARGSSSGATAFPVAKVRCRGRRWAANRRIDAD